MRDQINYCALFGIVALWGGPVVRADILNTATVRYQGAAGDNYTGQSNTVITISGSSESSLRGKNISRNGEYVLIPFSATKADTVSVQIYDRKGNNIRTLDVPVLSAGDYFVMWDTRNFMGELVASGVYFLTTPRREVRLGFKKAIIIR